MKDNTQKGPILVLISPILLLIGPILLLSGGAQGTPLALSSLRLCLISIANRQDLDKNYVKYSSQQTKNHNIVCFGMLMIVILLS